MSVLWIFPRSWVKSVDRGSADEAGAYAGRPAVVLNVAGSLRLGGRYYFGGWWRIRFGNTEQWNREFQGRGDIQILAIQGMPPTAALQRHAATSLRHLYAPGTLLPFLYCTTTIRHQHASASLSEANQYAHTPLSKNAVKGRHRRRKTADLGEGESNRSIEPGSNAGSEQEASHPRDVTNPGIESTIGFQGPQPASGQSPGHARHHRREPYTRKKASEVSKDYHLPFEGVEEETAEEQVKNDILRGTTVTGKERKAFEKLLQLGYGARQAKAKVIEEDGEVKKSVPQSSIGSHHDTRREYEESQRRDMPATLQPLVDEHWARSTIEEAKELSPLQQAVSSDVIRVRSRMREAKSDVELWRILHDEVIARVLALGLDNDPSRPSKPSIQQRAKTEDPFPDRDILMHSLQPHFRNFYHYCSRLFPGSPLQLSLLPRLKALGPISFAFAASTYVYNKHLSSLYRMNLDLPAFVATLEEMEHEVYEFDNRTYDILRQVLGRANFVKQGRAGEGTAALWGSERMKNNVGKVYLWSKKVRERLQEKALEEARAKETEEREIVDADEPEVVAA